MKIMEREKIAKLQDRLREALEFRKMKASELCERTDIPKGAISYYMAGKSQPKSDRLFLISKALGVSEAWLLGYDVPMERSQEQKKNDDLVKIIAKLRADSKFFTIVSNLAGLPVEQYDSLTTIISALGKK